MYNTVGTNLKMLLVRGTPKWNSALEIRKQPENVQSDLRNGLQWCEGRSYFEKSSAETLLSTVLQRDILIIWAGIHVELNIL